jgi:tRNA-binding EMAP/Myf-like protein
VAHTIDPVGRPYAPESVPRKDDTGGEGFTNYSVEELLGRLVVGAINLGSKRIAGFTSEFLILGSLDPDGTVRLLQLEDGVVPGAPVA